MTEGYKALTRSAATIDLTARTRIRATGEDRARLLHALTTNHIQQLLPGHGCYAFFLNANGRILADANILVFAEHILIDSEPEVRQSLWSHIDHYIIADDVELHDDAETTFCVAIEGPHAKERLSAVGIATPANQYAHESWQDLTVARLTWTGEPGFRIFGPLNRKQSVLDLLYLPEAAQAEADIVRIEHARPRYSVDIAAANLTAETGQTHALHFQKGCYLGQEIVERVRSRGHINKRLVAIEIDTTEPPPPATKLQAGGKDVGELTSAALSPLSGKVIGLAYVRVPHHESGAAFEIGQATGIVLREAASQNN